MFVSSVHSLVCNVNCAKQGSQGASWPLLCSEKLALCLPCYFTLVRSLAPGWRVQEAHRCLFGKAVVQVPPVGA